MLKRLYCLVEYCMKKILSLILVLGFTCNGAFATTQMQGAISRDYDASLESILKKKFGEILEISKVFEKNDDIFYQKKYKPVYMLSHKDFYSVAPKVVKSNIEKRKVPQVYNLSFNIENASFQNDISLNNESLEKEVAELVLLEQNDDFDIVQEKYKEILSKYPQRIELSYKYAQFLYLNKKYEEAIFVLNEIVKKDDSFILASYTLGNIYFDIGDYKKAVKANIAVIKKNPYCADAFFNIASALEKMQKYNLAIDYYQKCLSLNQNDTQAQKAIQRLEQVTYITY